MTILSKKGKLLIRNLCTTTYRKEQEMNTKEFEKNFSSYDGISRMLKEYSYDEILSAIAEITPYIH